MEVSQAFDGLFFYGFCMGDFSCEEDGSSREESGRVFFFSWVLCVVRDEDERRRKWGWVYR